MEQARKLFDQAGQIAPDWAPPYVGLANYYTALPFYSDVSPAEVLPKARTALAQALQLDESQAEAHAANAYIRAYYEWDWRAAEKEFRRALELQPNYADAYSRIAAFWHPPAAGRGHSPARSGRGAGPAFTLAAGESRAAGLFRGTLR